MNKIQLYIDGQRLDYNPESFELGIEGINPRELTNTPARFTNSFVVPATKTNNGIFKHYYNPDVIGLDALTRFSGFIELNGHLLAEGKFTLEGVQMRAGEPVSYNLSFVDNISALIDLFGDDDLEDIDLSAFDHIYSDSNVLTSLRGNDVASASSTGVIYAPITQIGQWTHNSGSFSAVSNTGNIAYVDASQLNGIDPLQLKPALRVSQLLDAIADNYGLTFSGDYSSQTDDIYLWFAGSENGIMEGVPQERTLITWQTLGTGWNTNGYVPPSGGSFTFTPTISPTQDIQFEIDVDGVTVFSERVLSGASVPVTAYATGLQGGEDVRFYARSLSTSQLQINTVTQVAVTGSFTSTGAKTSSQLVTRTIKMSEYAPEISVKDFVKGLANMFNWYIEPLSTTSFDLSSYDVNSGTERTVDLDLTEYSIRRTELYNEIKFMSADSDAILSNEYRERVGRNFGDLSASFAFDGTKLEVQHPFSILVPERQTDEANGSQVVYSIGRQYDASNAGVNDTPLLFQAFVRTSLNIAYIDSGSAVQVTTMWNPAISNGATSPSLNIVYDGTTINPDTNLPVNNSLYSLYYQAQVEDVYQDSRRFWDISTVLTFNQMISLKPNDTLIVQGRKHKIISGSVNVLTGRAQFTTYNTEL